MTSEKLSPRPRIALSLATVAVKDLHFETLMRSACGQQAQWAAPSLGMSLSDEGLAQHLAALMPSIAAFNIIDKMPDEKPMVTYPRAVPERETRRA